MKSSTVSRFWSAYEELPNSIQAIAKKQFRLWIRDQSHPSIQFKKVGPFWSARITDDFRALAYKRDDTFYWFWIGRHSEYDKILKSNA